MAERGIAEKVACLARRLLVTLSGDAGGAVPRRGRVPVHLFELKIDDNVKLGILPEALWYARLVHRSRIGDFGGRA